MILYLYKLLKAVFRTILIVINNIYTTIPYCIWMLLLSSIKPFNKDLYFKIEEILYGWIISVVTVWSWTAGYNIIEMGDRLTSCSTTGGRILILANHQSTADVLLLMAFFNANKYIKNVMWIMDWIFCITHFGAISYLHGDIFILSGNHIREEAQRQLKQHINTIFLPSNKKFIMLFPEGGFLRKRRERSKCYAAKHNISNTISNVALPRTGAYQTIMQVMTLQPDKTNNYLNNENNEIKWILDVTIAYENGIPLDLFNILTGWRRPCKVYMLYRLFPGSQIAQSDEDITKWLYDLWEEKDKILESFYSQDMPFKYCPMYNKGEFQYPKEIKQNIIGLIIANVFYLLSTYLHYRLICYFISVIWQYKYSIYVVCIFLRKTFSLFPLKF